MLTLSLEPRADAADAHVDDRREVAIWRDADGTACARVLARGATRWIDWPGIGVFSFLTDSLLVHASPAAGVAVGELTDFFERRLQPLILQARGFQALHASAVLGPDGVTVFCGISGSGKSTLAYALGSDTCSQIADDALVIDCAAVHPEACLLPFAAQLRGAAREWLERPAQSAPGDSRAESCAVARAGRAPIHLIVLLHQDEAGPAVPQIQRVEGPAACVALLAHAHCLNAEGDAGRLVVDYASLAHSVPVSMLTYRPRLPELPVLVAAVHALMAATPPPSAATASVSDAWRQG